MKWLWSVLFIARIIDPTGAIVIRDIKDFLKADDIWKLTLKDGRIIYTPVALTILEEEKK